LGTPTALEESGFRDGELDFEESCMGGMGVRLLEPLGAIDEVVTLRVLDRENVGEGFGAPGEPTLLADDPPGAIEADERLEEELLERLGESRVLIGLEESPVVCGSKGFGVGDCGGLKLGTGRVEGPFGAPKRLLVFDRGLLEAMDDVVREGEDSPGKGGGRLLPLVEDTVICEVDSFGIGDGTEPDVRIGVNVAVIVAFVVFPMVLDSHAGENGHVLYVVGEYIVV
jgi:hypothetical protein